MGKLALILVFGTILFAGTPEWHRAHELYRRTEYQQSLNVIQSIVHKDAATLELMGKDYYGLGEYKKATEAFEKAIVLDPTNSEMFHWLGRTYGRRAETRNVFTASGYANKTRQMFEKAVALDPSNKEAVNDLFDYYLEAPGFLGGGMKKAEDLVALIASNDAAEGNYAQAQLDDRRKEYDAAEQHLRRAAELAPRQVGRVLDVAKYLAKRGRTNESEAMFDKAARMAPDSPKVLFDRADTYVKEKRNLEDARQMLQLYLRAPLTPDDPPREQAEALLKKIGS